MRVIIQINKFREIKFNFIIQNKTKNHNLNIGKDYMKKIKLNY